MTTSDTTSGADQESQELTKQIGLWGVYCISTGAMFSSGFFLLPGLAAATAGPSTVLAYLLAGLLMIPSMLSMAELSTGLPRAGGSYYFLDRSMGPAVGTVGGLGTWLALVLKSGFALLGMGAYLAIMPGLAGVLDWGDGESIWPIKLLAVVLAVVFGAVNVFGARQSVRIQGVLVAILLVVLGFFVFQGLWHVLGGGLEPGDLEGRYTPFLHEENGMAGLASTIGLVFVSYAGLTKVASVSEEVHRPERNLPLGMFLSLGTATIIDVLGVFIIIATVDMERLREDYAPVASAAENFFDWLPGELGLILIVVAALAAFASTGNAGILAASRYPLAMARDKLAPERLKRIGRFGTPTAAIVLTTALVIVFIVGLSAESVAKVGSTFNLLVFALLNVAVIIMRESRIETYDPGFRVPLYPWTPLAGSIISVWLIFEMGLLSIVFALGVVFVGTAWYLYYAKPRIERSGAVLHVAERLGRHRHEPLHGEFREIVKENGLREEDPFDELVIRADASDLEPGTDFDEALDVAAARLASRIPMEKQRIAGQFRHTGRSAGVPISRGVVIVHFRSGELDRAEIIIMRARDAVTVTMPSDAPEGSDERADAASGAANALLFLVSPDDESGEHLRTLAHIAGRVEDESFASRWRDATHPLELKELLLRHDRFVVIHVGERPEFEPLVGARLAELDLPAKAKLAMIGRGGDAVRPSPSVILEPGDRLTIVGGSGAIDEVRTRYLPAPDPG